MRVVKSGSKWIVSGQGDGWILKREYPNKWKAALALRVWKEGGRVSDYWAAAREEKDRRSQIAQEQADRAARRKLESAWRKYPDGAVIDDGQLITVRRQPNDWRAAQVPFSELTDFHLTQVSGGLGSVTLHYGLYARMWCSSIPEGVEFAHSCQHGPPPHEILVVINRQDNGEIHDQLLSLARLRGFHPGGGGHAGFPR